MTTPQRITLALLLVLGVFLLARLMLPAEAPERVVDLSYTYDESTLFWPTSPTSYELHTVHNGDTPDGYFYSAFSFSMPEHGGTHMDAPFHFYREGRPIDQIPLEQLRLPAVVIDISAKAAGNRDYRLTAQDVLDFEAEHGRIKPGHAVLVRTGWSQYWPNAKAYLGDDTPGDASRLSFPSFGADAARLLAEQRQVGLLGIDTASLDYGRSTDFIVHRIVSRQNIPGLENLTNLEQLPPTGFTLLALPIKIGGGSGGPVRVLAVLPE